MKTPRREEPAPVVGKAYDLNLWILQKIEKFPRSHRHEVGDRLASNALDLLLNLVEAAYAVEKAELVKRAGARTNAVRYLLRMSKDLHLMSVDSYGFAAERLDEIGRMIGGWQKSVVSKT